MCKRAVGELDGRDCRTAEREIRRRHLACGGAGACFRRPDLQEYAELPALSAGPLSERRLHDCGCGAELHLAARNRADADDRALHVRGIPVLRGDARHHGPKPVQQSRAQPRRDGEHLSRHVHGQCRQGDRRRHRRSRRHGHSADPHDPDRLRPDLRLGLAQDPVEPLPDLLGAAHPGTDPVRRELLDLHLFLPDGGPKPISTASAPASRSSATSCPSCWRRPASRCSTG